jgi:hypothetical protein
MIWLRHLALKYLGIKENPFISFGIGNDEHGKPILVYTDRRGEKIIKDKLDLWMQAPFVERREGERRK